MRHGRCASPGRPARPAPALLAADPDGTAAGVLAVLMSRLPGRVNRRPSDTDRWLRRLAKVLPAIDATPLPAADVLPRFAPYPQASYQPPNWARFRQSARGVRGKALRTKGSPAASGAHHCPQRLGLLPQESNSKGARIWREA